MDNKLKRIMMLWLLLTGSLISSGAAFSVSATSFEIGTGIYDITGPAAEIGMFGYFNSAQSAQGIHQRLRSRAFAVHKPDAGTHLMFVSADLPAMFQSVKIEVINRLKNKYGDIYTEENVMLTATHTHVGPGGLSHYGLYILASTTGYSPQNFEIVVNGIVKSIERAHNNLAPGSISYNKGKLINTSKNRSLTAYNANPNSQDYPETNTDMTVLKFIKDNGKEIGMINWFAVHNTSFSKDFRYISGDNKGYASYKMERDKATNYQGDDTDDTFVAAFANSDEGDSVPSAGNSNSSPGFQGSTNEFANVSAAANAQYAMGAQLYTEANEPLSGNLDYRHKWVNMAHYQVSSEYTGNKDQALCHAARGFSMAAGGENGSSDVPGIYEGMTIDNYNNTNGAEGIKAFLGSFIQGVLGGLTTFTNAPCQYPKPVFLPTGALNLVPNTLPFQVFVIGKLAIVSVPGEMTTMAGRKLRDTVIATLATKGVSDVVIAGLANTYSGYIATFEEYQKQHYEGASTEFGPYTLNAYQQIYAELANSVLDPTSTITGSATPKDLSGIPQYQSAGVVFDDKRLWEKFGQVMKNTKKSYSSGDTVMVSFRAGHPKNNPQIQGSFLKIERNIGGNWLTIKQDWDWDTKYRWRRDKSWDCTACSFADVIWEIPTDTKSGTYRISHSGHWKNGWNGNINAYSGVSRTFTVN